MFGYIKPYRPELKIREAEEYKSIYCGLCKELGKSYGLFAKMTLSYDFAFMAMLFMSINSEICPTEEKCRCIVHPIKEQCFCSKNSATSLSATAAVILVYYKLKDDLADKGTIKKILAFLLMPFAKAARKKALAGGGDAVFIDNAVQKMTEAQLSLEKASCARSDEAAEPTAKFIEEIITLGGKKEDERALRRFGYLLGRYIYLCDAMDDLEDDRKKGNYNPFVFGEKKAFDDAKSAIFVTVAELSDDLALLPLDRYKEIVENIICMGLKNEALVILKRRDKNGSV